MIRIPTSCSLALAIISLSAAPVRAVINDFTCANDVWSNSACWTEGAPPNSTDTARITINNQVDYEYTGGGVVQLSSLQLQTGTLLTQSQEVLKTSALQINSTFGGVARYEHSGGTLNVAGTAILGVNPFDTTGEYDLSGTGQLTVGGQMLVGNQGIGTVTQSGGSADIGTIVLSNVSTSSGSYTMTGGTLTAGIISRGAGSGDFDQSGGSSTVTGNFINVDATLSGGLMNVQGTFDPENFTLSGTGQLTVGSVVTLSSSSTFSQTGGDADFDTLNLNAPGTLNLLGGTLDVTNLNLNGATFSGTGGTFSYTNIDMGGGTLDLDLTVGAGQTLDAAGVVTGALTLTADGTANILGDLSVGSLDNSADLALGTRNLQLNGASINTGSISLAGGSIGGPGALSNAGAMSGWGEINGPLANSGTLTQTGGDLTVAGALVNTGLFSQVNGNLIVDGGSFTNDGTATMLGSSVKLIDGDLTNNATLNLLDNTVSGAGTFQVGAGGHTAGYGRITTAIDNAGILEARNGNLLIAGSGLTNTGTLKNAVGANLFIAAASVVNQGNLEVNAAGAVTFTDAVVNTGGHVVDLKGGALSTPTLTNESGAEVRGAGSITGNLINAGDTDFFGTTSIFGDVNNQATGHFLVRNDQTLVTGHTINDGTIETLNGSVIFEGGLTNNGALLFDPSTLTFSTLSVGSVGTLAETGEPGDRIIITEDLINASTQNNDWQTSNTIFQFNGGSRDAANAQELEAAGADLGNHFNSWQDNFALGTLEVGTSDTYLSLIDTFDNSVGSGPEALYLFDLIVHDGATFDFGDLNVYIFNGISGSGALVGTGNLTVGAVPIPAAAYLFFSAIAMLGATAFRRRHKSTMIKSIVALLHNS